MPTETNIAQTLTATQSVLWAHSKKVQEALRVAAARAVGDEGPRASGAEGPIHGGVTVSPELLQDTRHLAPAGGLVAAAGKPREEVHP